MFVMKLYFIHIHLGTDIKRWFQLETVLPTTIECSHDYGGKMTCKFASSLELYDITQNTSIYCKWLYLTWKSLKDLRLIQFLFKTYLCRVFVSLAEFTYLTYGSINFHDPIFWTTGNLYRSVRTYGRFPFSISWFFKNF